MFIYVGHDSYVRDAKAGFSRGDRQASLKCCFEEWVNIGSPGYSIRWGSLAVGATGHWRSSVVLSKLHDP